MKLADLATGSDWIVWIVFAIFAVLSIILLSGHGSWFISGYNTASNEEKEKYDEKKLCVNFNLVQSMCDRLQSVADQNDISFIVGTIFKEKEIYNRALLFQPNKQIKSYDKRALWGWDNDNFAKGNSDGIVEIDGVVFGIRICFEIRFPEFFRELYKRNTDINVVLFYDVADTDDKERYSMIRGHLQTRAVENVTTTISVNATSPFQTAPTMVFGKSGQCIKECVRNKPELLIYDFEKTVNDFGENGRTSISDSLINW